jgi:hypothetical protein
MKLLTRFQLRRSTSIILNTRADNPKYGGSINESGGSFGRKEQFEESKYFRQRELDEIKELAKSLKKPTPKKSEKSDADSHQDDKK